VNGGTLASPLHRGVRDAFGPPLWKRGERQCPLHPFFQRRAYRSASQHLFEVVRASIPATFVPPPINLSAVTNCMNYDCLFLVKNLIDDAVITHAGFIESCELTRHVSGLMASSRGQPSDALNDATTKRFVQSCHLTHSRVQDADTIHSDYSNPSRRTTSSSGSPRSPHCNSCFWRKSLSRTDFLWATFIRIVEPF